MSAWKKSSFSNGTGGNNCVEVKVIRNADVVVVRNSNVPEPETCFTRAEWSAFLAGVKAGEFDIEQE